MTRLHVVFKTHLDLGFTDLAANVKKAYFEGYIPQALQLARQTREEGSDRFVWTTGSWLIHEFLETQDASAIRELETGIEAGDILWHGLPFTTHSELMDASLFRHGLSISQRLDSRFGKKTIAAKMTDVPGHTRAIVPLLAEAGIEMLHLGVNPASSVPEVPPVFRWRHTDGSELIVMYHQDYGGVEPIPGTDEALAFGHTGDNLGPQKPNQIKDFYRGLRERFPVALIEATSLNAVAESLRSVRDQLPVVEDEIGDTWIHGVATDPTKVRLFRHLSLMHRLPNSDRKDDHRFQRFSDSLLCVPEHTWGRDIKRFNDGVAYVEPTYESAAFAQKRQEGEYREYEASWAEQGAYLNEAIQNLGDLAEGMPTEADRYDLDPVRSKISRVVNYAHRIEIEGDRVWLLDAEGQVRLDGFSLAYQTFGSEDFDEFTKSYNPNLEGTRNWAIPDFGKPGLETVLKRGEIRILALKDVQIHIDGFLLRFQGEGLGCPEEILLQFQLREGARPLQIQAEWRSKPASRIPEAIWLSMKVPDAMNDAFRLVKLGEEIDPTKVVRKGARRNHAVEEVRYNDGERSVRIGNPDSPLVSISGPGLLRFDDADPRPADGLWFNLYNNVWGTNFPLWFNEPAFFRFIVSAA